MTVSCWDLGCTSTGSMCDQHQEKHLSAVVQFIIKLGNHWTSFQEGSRVFSRYINTYIHKCLLIFHSSWTGGHSHGFLDKATWFHTRKIREIILRAVDNTYWLRTFVLAPLGNKYFDLSLGIGDERKKSRKIYWDN